MFFLLFSFFLTVMMHSQDNRQIILSKSVELKYQVGEGYQRDTLSPQEIKEADSLVAKYVLENHSKYSWTRKIQNYYAYNRQYAGYRIGTPEKTIFINVFFQNTGTETDKYFQEHLIQARGGGSDFFTIKVNLQTHTCFDLRVNAPK